VIGSLSEVLEGYLDLRWRIVPVEATWAGRGGLDGELGWYDPRSVREHVAALRSYTGALEQVAADTLDDEIDRTAALHDARHLLLVLERERPFARSPAFHLSEVLSGLGALLIRPVPSWPVRASALLERLQAVPDFLGRALEALTEPALPLVDLARAMLPDVEWLVREGLDDLGIDRSSLDAATFAAARRRALSALSDFGAALTGMARRARGSGALGRELFDRKLHTAHLIREGAEELLRYGEQLRAESQAALERIAGAIEPGTDWRDLVARFRADLPSGVYPIEVYAEALRAMRELTGSSGLMRVAEEGLQVVETPRPLRPLVPRLTYAGRGAFDAPRDATLFVTLGGAVAAPAPRGRSEIRLAAAREGIPGRHQLHATTAGLTRTVRRVLGTPVTAAGWALYAESLVIEHGILDAPVERLFHARDLLLHALRLIIDVSVHTKGLTAEAAVGRLTRESDLDEAAAAAEVAACLTHPTGLLAGAVGRREILRLRDDLRRERGPAFSLAELHDRLLEYGLLPAALARWGMGLA
jgi:hypothetical protein